MQAIRNTSVGIIESPAMVWVVNELEKEFPWEDTHKEYFFEGTEAEELILSIEDLSNDDIGYLMAKSSN